MKYVYIIDEEMGVIRGDNKKEGMNTPKRRKLYGKIGRKAENLIQLQEKGFPVPGFCVVTDRYFKEVILNEIKTFLVENNLYHIKGESNSLYLPKEGDDDKKDGRSLSTKIIQKLREIIRDHRFNDDFVKEVMDITGNASYYAVRSSSVEEDGMSSSFAGQFETFLYVRSDEMMEKIREVWLSSFSDHIIEYRVERKVNNKINVPSVIIQKMISSEKSGVAFSANPVSGKRDEMVISATLGLGTAIVDGDEDGDLYIYDRNIGKVKKEIRIKTVRHILDHASRKIIKENIHIEEQVLLDSEIELLSKEVEKIESHYGLPQDIEWAFSEGRLYILQSRPITTLKKEDYKADNSGMDNINDNIIIWDNSNIVESYPEITLPLTFSFIRKAYSSVYRQFSRVVGVPEKIREGYSSVYENMLGILQGRVYYNMLNWYKLILLFPNAEENSRFMEQMMGVRDEIRKEELHEDILQAEKDMTFMEKIKGRAGKFKAGFSLFLNIFLIEEKARRFCNFIDDSLKSAENKLDTMNMGELKKYYRHLEGRFLNKWDVPIINDFLVMIWFGISRKLLKGNIEGSLEEAHNILIAQEGQDMISVEPSIYINKMGKILEKDEKIKKEIEKIIYEYEKYVEKSRKKMNTPKEFKIDSLERFTENIKFNTLLKEYMEKFGDRTVHELKLESKTLKENPILLIKMIYAVSMVNERVESERRNISEEQEGIYKAIKTGPVRKYFLKKSVAYARKFIRLRENLRYERTKVFGMVRKIMKRMAAYLKNEGIIMEEEDIFYMTLDEVFALTEGILIDTDIMRTVEARKEKYNVYRKIEPLPDRFMTRGLIGENFIFQDLTYTVNESVEGSKGEDNDNGSGEKEYKELKGTGCSKGIVSGKVKVVLNPMVTEIEEGDIVVTKSTDPSWVMVFPLISGLVVEKGSLLSHSAIISREMNIPAVVGVTGATTYLRTGDYVWLDGSSGIVRKIESERKEG